MGRNGLPRFEKNSGYGRVLVLNSVYFSITGVANGYFLESQELLTKFLSGST